MKKIIVLCFLIITSGNSFAQQITFQKTYGGTSVENAYCVQQTNDGGYIISAQTYSFGAGGYDVYLVKTNGNGDLQWAKTYGGPGFEEGYFIQQTSDGGFIVSGTTASFGPAGGVAYLMKTDSAGNMIWMKTYGYADEAGGPVQQTTDGGYIVAGWTAGFGAGGIDVYVIKTDSIGDTLWTRSYGEASVDGALSIKQTNDGGYIITGHTFDSGSSTYNIYLIKIDSSGNMLWSKIFGGNGNDDGFSVQQTNDNGYIIAGTTQSFSSGFFDIYLIRTDPIGSIIWSKIYGGVNNDNGSFIRVTSDNGFIFGGNTNSFGAGGTDAYLIKSDSVGNVMWSKTYGGAGTDLAVSIQLTNDGGYVIVGKTHSFGAGSSDLYLIKTDSLGNSGCNENISATVSSSPPTQTYLPATLLNSGSLVTLATPSVGIGGTEATLCFSTGIPFALVPPQSAFTIAPNPTPPDASGFTITFPGIINKGTIEIYNFLGEKMMGENIFNTNQKEIHFKNISAGIYFVKVQEGEKEYAEKFVVK